MRLEEKANEEYVVIKSNYMKRLVRLRDILYIKALSDWVIYNTIENGTPNKYMTRATMKETEKLLEEKSFVRCHRSFIVNLNYARGIKGSDIFIKKDITDDIQKVPIGKHYMKPFKQIVSEKAVN